MREIMASMPLYAHYDLPSHVQDVRACALLLTEPRPERVLLGGAEPERVPVVRREGVNDPGLLFR